MKKNMKSDTPNFSTHHPISTGFYSDDVGSHQNVQFLKGTELSYQQDSLQREYDMHQMLPMHPCDPSRKVSNLEQFQGQVTFNMHSPTKNQYDGDAPDHLDRDMF